MVPGLKSPKKAKKNGETRRGINNCIELLDNSSDQEDVSSSVRKAKNKDEVIEIVDSSSEEDSSDEEEMFSLGCDESNRIVEVSCEIADWARFVYTHILSQLASYPFLSCRVQQSLLSQVTIIQSMLHAFRLERRYSNRSAL